MSHNPDNGKDGKVMNNIKLADCIRLADYSGNTTEGTGEAASLYAVKYTYDTGLLVIKKFEVYEDTSIPKRNGWEACGNHKAEKFYRSQDKKLAVDPSYSSAYVFTDDQATYTSLAIDVLSKADKYLRAQKPVNLWLTKRLKLDNALSGLLNYLQSMVACQEDV